MLKIIIFFIATTSFCSCHSTKQIQRNNNITIVSFTSQKWYGGIPNVGGINYEVKVIASNMFLSDSLWINDKRCKLTLFTTEGINLPYKQGDTLILKCGIRNEKNNPTLPDDTKLNSLKVTPPLTHRGKALMSYYIDHERKFMVLDSIIVKEPIFYP